MKTTQAPGSRPIHIWTDEVEDSARRQLDNLAKLPFLHPHGVAVMPDVHAGIGSTVGTVIATYKAIIPAAVGVDIGCGMNAVRVSLKASDLPDSLGELRHDIERSVPLGAGGAHRDDKPLHAEAPASVLAAASTRNAGKQLGTLGSGNHFIEICLDENEDVWVVLHSGSRGIGNQIGRYYIEKAKKLMERYFIALPDGDLAYLPEDTDEFRDYVEAVQWAQEYALENRRRMMAAVLDSMRHRIKKPFTVTQEAINCLAGETVVMTRAGNRSIAELSGAEHELLTRGGAWAKAPIRSFGRQKLIEVTFSRSGVTKTIRATAGHRWLLHNVQRAPTEVTTAELKPGNRLRHTFPAPVPCAMERDAVARGFVFGDGSVMHGKACANFCGAKDETLLGFFEGRKPPFQYAKFKRITSLPAEWKTEFPDLDSPPASLRGWLAGYFAADGDVDETGRPILASARRENLDFVRRLCTTIGIGTFGIRKRMRSGFGNPETPLYMVGLMRADLTEDFFLLDAHRLRFISGKDAIERRSWNVVGLRETGDVEEVFCAVVDGTHSFALEDNILTGNCHHNYVEMESHYGKNVYVTRKGAIRAREGDLGVIPGSMGARSYIVRGKGNAASYCSCSHGAGRRMSRSAARKAFTVADLAAQTQGVECRKDDAVLDEIPGAYKDIDEVMENQRDLVEVVHTLRQVLCVKGN